MKRKTVSGITLTLLSISMLTLALNIQPAKSEPTTWTVDDDGPADFHTIQEAINAASLGHTIFVKAGTYNENVVVDKSVSLLGENKHNTVIDGNYTGTVVYVGATNNVTISGFTIQNSGLADGMHGYVDSGIYVCNSNATNITHNIVTNNLAGIWLDISSNNSLTGNNLSHNQYNFGVLGWHPHFNHYVDTSNTVEGKPIYYWINKANAIIDAQTNAGTVYLINCNNITIRDLTVAKNGQGIGFWNTTNSKIENVTASNNFVGIGLGLSRDNIVMGCNSSNNVVGISVSMGSDNITLSGNLVSSNNLYGIGFYYSNNTIIYRNQIMSNYDGIYLMSHSYNNSIIENEVISNNRYGIYQEDHCDDNVIYHNNFINNTAKQKVGWKSVNIWDNGYPSGGNYWSDYTGVDEKSGSNQDQPGSDGIGDAPYVIDADNRDRYPLMKPWTPTPPTPRTWTVDDDLQDYPDADFTKIQDAVYVAAAGDAIIVYPGTYIENLDVNKSLTIKSENAADVTFVQAANSDDHVFEITTDDVNISGFTIRGATENNMVGIRLSTVNYCNISNNRVTNNWGGVYLEQSSHNNVINNEATNNWEGIVISRYSDSNFIYNNTVLVNAHGILVYGSSGNNIVSNIANLNNYYSGIYIGYSSNNILTNNIANSNTENGIHLHYSSNNKLTNNTANSNGLHGIFLVSSSNNTLTNNIVSSNNDGICLTGPWPSISNLSSDNNILSNNTVSDNTYYGIGICASSSNNILFNNNIANNNRGVEFYNNASHNEIYSNNFIDNTRNAYSYFNLTNIWNSTSKITYNYNGKTYTNYLGNYWSDYTGSDADEDGIGDTPYSIDSDKDNYPLMEPFENYRLVPPPENQPPTCAIELRKDGVEIAETDVWEFFDIYVGGSTDDTGIKYVRFSSDDSQDDLPTGQWTKWYEWNVSSDDWDAATKIKRWAFATGGAKEVWAEAKDDSGQSARRSANIQAILPAIVITSPLEITPKGPYYTGDSLTATFTIKNIGDVPVNLDVLTVGGRDPDGLVIDFDWKRNIIINANDEYVYTGKLTLPSRAGNYNFFCIYRTRYECWNPRIDLGEGLTDEDRADDIMVLERYPLGGIIVPVEIFPEGNGHVIPIYVPPVIDNSNALREQDGWETMKEIESSRLDFEWKKMIASLTLEREDTPQGAAFSFIAGFITSVNNAFSRSDFKITIQKNSEGNLRAMIQMGDPDVNTFMRTHAGDVLPLFFESAYLKAVFSQYVTEAFHLQPAKWYTYYTMEMQIDSSHKEDEYTYYVSLSEDNRILLTPKVHQQDKLRIIRVYEVIFPYKVETVIELAGSEFVNFEKSLVSREETKSIMEILDPILLLPKSAIITIGQSPCEFRVYDSHENVTGLVNGEIKEQIPNSMYFNVTKTIVVFNPIDTYYYEVVGIDTGVYHLEIISAEDWNTTTFTASNISIIANTTHQYTIDWAALSLGEEGVTVKTDSDADGVFEHTFTSDSELTRDEFMLEVPSAEAFPMWIVGVAVAAIAVVTVAIAVIWRRRKQTPMEGRAR